MPDETDPVPAFGDVLPQDLNQLPADANEMSQSDGWWRSDPVHRRRDAVPGCSGNALSRRRLGYTVPGIGD